MNRFSEEIQEKLFAQCSVEQLVALRQTCQSFYTTLNSLDESLVRQKVLQRVPWFSVNDTDAGNDSWNKCALLIARRSAQATKKGDTKWKLMADLHVAMVSKPQIVSVDATDITNHSDKAAEVLGSCSAIFEGAEYLIPSGNGVVDGVKIKTDGIEVDLTTLQTSPSAYKPAKPQTFGPGASGRAFSVCTPSGLVIKSADTEQRVTCVAENDSLLHIRMQNVFDMDRDENAVEFEESDLEWLIHKPSCKRDRSGILIVDEDKSVPLLPQGSHGKTFIKLLPGAAGALVTKYVDTNYSFTYLGYVEPTKQMRHTVICYLPRVRPSVGYDYFDASIDVFVSYNGYFYLYYEGRFVQLWVDLGKHRLLEWDARHMLYGHSDLPQKIDTQSLTACRVGFPTMGTIMTIQQYHERHVIVRGKKEHGMDRYVTIDQRHGQAVIDLLTGKMHLCQYDHEKDLVLPLVCEDQVCEDKKIVFACISDMVFGRLEKRLAQLLKKNQADSNLAASYAQWASIYIPIQAAKSSRDARVIPDSGLYEMAKAVEHMYAKGVEYGTFDEVVQRAKKLGPRPKAGCACGKCEEDMEEIDVAAEYGAEYVAAEFVDSIDEGEDDDDYEDVSDDEWGSEEDDDDVDDDSEDDDSEDDDSEDDNSDAYDSDDIYFVKTANPDPAYERTRADIRKAFEDEPDHPDDDRFYADDTEEDFEQLREAFAGMLLHPDDKQSAARMFAVGLNDGYIRKKPLPRRHGKMFGPYMDGYAYGVEKMSNEIVADMVRETKEAGGLEAMLRANGYDGKGRKPKKGKKAARR